MLRPGKVALLVVLAAGAALFIFSRSSPERQVATSGDADGQVNDQETGSGIDIIAENLTIPWEIAFLPDGSLLVTERSGQLLKFAGNKVALPIDGVRHTGEGGLLGLAVHPEFSQNGWIYLYLTTQTDQELVNRVERYRLEGTRLIDRTVIIANIPGAPFHDGGRIAFGPASAEAAGRPDYFLYITTGDAGNESAAQDVNSLAGKILRLHDDGSLPADNPFGNAVYSYGHRNPQGLAWDNNGRLWATEHGRSGVQSGLDEINLITGGANYGWPSIEGDAKQTGMTSPAAHSGARTTWAPAGAAFWQGSLFYAGLRGEALYQARLDGDQVVEIIPHLQGQYGRLRAVVLGPDGLLYITTSNRDGRGSVKAGDDKILRLDPERLP